MDKEAILDKVVAFVETKKNVTLFQVAYETTLSFYDVSNAFQACVNYGILAETTGGELYSVVPKEKRVSLEWEEEQRMMSILDKFSDKEIDFLKDVMDNHTRSEVNESCREKEGEFSQFKAHFVAVGLFVNKNEDYKLALSEQEYLCFWNILWDYPKQIVKGKETSGTKETPQGEEKESKDKKAEKKFLSIEEILAKRGIIVSSDATDEENTETSADTAFDTDTIIRERKQNNKKFLRRIMSSFSLEKDGKTVEVTDNFDTFTACVYSGTDEFTICGTIGSNGAVYMNDNGETILHVEEYTKNVTQIEEILVQYGVEKHWERDGDEYVLTKTTNLDSLTEGFRSFVSCIIAIIDL